MAQTHLAIFFQTVWKEETLYRIDLALVNQEKV